MAETVVTKERRKKSYAELLNELGEALLRRGELEDELYNLTEKKNEQRTIARRAKWFSEDRYRKWAKYYSLKADIVSVRRDIKTNDQRIVSLEQEITNCRVCTTPAPTPKPE